MEAHTMYNNQECYVRVQQDSPICNSCVWVPYSSIAQAKLHHLQYILWASLWCATLQCIIMWSTIHTITHWNNVETYNWGNCFCINPPHTRKFKKLKIKKVISFGEIVIYNLVDRFRFTTIHAKRVWTGSHLVESLSNEHYFPSNWLTT